MEISNSSSQDFAFAAKQYFKKELARRPIPKNAPHSFLAAYNAVA